WNPITRRGATSEIATDVLLIQSTLGSNPGPLVKVPSFLFTCVPSFLLQNGFPYGAQGVVGFGHTPIALPTQLASHFGFPPKFALCLSPDPVNGVIFIGDGPYIMLPGINVSQNLLFSPSMVSPQGEYFIEVTSIKINGKAVPLNISFLSIHKSGNISSTRLGAGVPPIELVLCSPNVSWSIFGANSMVMARHGVLCLAFVDGGLNPSNDIVIGTHQFEDKLLQFDLAKSRLVSSQSPSSPTALVLPVTKHASTLQYLTKISQGTPLVSTNVVIDLEGQFLWISCNSGNVSSTHHYAHCNSTQCSLAHETQTCSHCLSKPGPPQCNNDDNTCLLLSENVFTGRVSSGDLSEDVIGIQSTDGLNPGPLAILPQFIFSCVPAFLSQGLASGATGIAGLGQAKIGLPLQLSTSFNFSKKFAMCLPPSTSSVGVIFFGDGPYVLLPNIDISKILIYTPLIINKHSHDHYIGVKSIRVNGNKIPIKTSLLLINSRGNGGTKISTVNPYTVLETSIYRSLAESFIKEALRGNATKVSSVAPFEVCFSTKSNEGNLLRPALPIIDLVLQTNKVFWRIFETNSMVPVNNDIACLAFMDGGYNPEASIVLDKLCLF
ncbi:Xylanase inhibitor, N-terminal, partial [Dillenia turbinata]